MAHKLIIDILNAIQEDESLVKDYVDSTVVKAVFEQNYNPAKAWKLPEGEPPFRPAPEPKGMTPTPFASSLRLWQNFAREDIKDGKREGLFIQLLESVHPDEAQLLLTLKDGKLSSLYPFATHEFGVKHGFLTQTAPKVEV